MVDKQDDAAARIRQLIKDQWGRRDLDDVVRQAQAIDPAMTRRRLTSTAHRMREQHIISPRQAYRTRTTTRRWTEQDDALLRELAGNASMEEIAARFGTSELALRKHASELRVSLAFINSPPVPYTDEELQFAAVVKVEAARLGMSANRIASAIRRIAADEQGREENDSTAAPR